MPPVKILCAGDSLTLGSAAYRGSFRRHLLNLAPNLTMVGSQRDWSGNDGYGPHEGYSGGTEAIRDSDILPQIDVYTPEVVTIWFGANEITGQTDDTNFPTLLAALYEFAGECLAKTSVSTVIVGTCAPRRSNDSKYSLQNDYRDAMNTYFQTTEAPLTSGIYHCDPGAVIDSDTYFGDALHLTDAGYALVAPVWYQALVSAGVQLSQDQAGADAGDVV